MPNGRILIVEDRDSLRRMLEAALGQEGYEVTTAADGEAGIRLLAARPFDFVLTDLKLPDVSGLRHVSVLASVSNAGERPRKVWVELRGASNDAPVAADRDLEAGAFGELTQDCIAHVVTGARQIDRFARGRRGRQE